MYRMFIPVRVSIDLNPGLKSSASHRFVTHTKKVVS
jgi:hypothetical protein